MKLAGFPVKKRLEDFDFEFQPSIDKAVSSDLALLRFVYNGPVQTFVSSGAIEINHRSTCSKTDAVDYIEKPKGTIQISKFDKDREKLRNYSSSWKTPTISRSTPTLTKGSYSISNGTLVTRTFVLPQYAPQKQVKYYNYTIKM